MPKKSTHTSNTQTPWDHTGARDLWSAQPLCATPSIQNQQIIHVNVPKILLKKHQLVVYSTLKQNNIHNEQKKRKLLRLQH